jgi:pimeloyl-ACP methyl ester carboxylesterase
VASGSASVREVSVGGTPLAVREWGRSGGRPILFWHALGPAMSAAYAAELEPALGEGWRLVAPDGPGFGASPALSAERYAIPRLAELLWGLADRLGLGRPVLGGHSWGGVVASAAAAARPERVAGLLLLDSGHRDYQEDPTFSAAKALEEYVAEAGRPDRLLRFDGWEPLFEELAGAVRRPLTPSLREAARAGFREEAGGSIVAIPTPEAQGAARYGLGQTRASASWPALAASGVPVLLLLATEPPELAAVNRRAAAVYAAAVPQAEIELVEGATHSLLTDRGPEAAALLADWLRRLPPE